MPSRPAVDDAAGNATMHGQVIEYIRGKHDSLRFTAVEQRQQKDLELIHTKQTDRLYLASYTHQPSERTPFPYPSKETSPSKRRARAASPQRAAGPTQPPVYFSIDKFLLYNAFHADFGPLHIGHLYRFAVHLHEVLAQPDNEGRPVVFWSHADSKSAFFISSRSYSSANLLPRPGERSMYPCLLHGLDPIMASTSGIGTNCTD